MALILSLKEGQDFYVGNERFVLTEIVDENRFRLVHDIANGPAEPKPMLITDERSREVLPDVFVSAGEMHQTNVASIVIDAPREILILRGDLRRADPSYKESA